MCIRDRGWGLEFYLGAANRFFKKAGFLPWNSYLLDVQFWQKISSPFGSSFGKIKGAVGCLTEAGITAKSGQHDITGDFGWREEGIYLAIKLFYFVPRPSCLPWFLLQPTWSTQKWLFVLHFFVEKYQFELSKIKHTSFKWQSNSNWIFTGYIPVQYQISGYLHYLQIAQQPVWSTQGAPFDCWPEKTKQNTKTKATMVDRKPPWLLWKTIK